MSIYGFATKTIAEPANDALVPTFTVYTRTTETGAIQLNNRINPQIAQEEWVDIPNRVYQVILNPESNLTIGKLVAHYAQEARFADAWRDKYDRAREEATRAVEMIGERLIQESNDRGWCSEFDELIDAANSNLPGWLQLPTRVREFNVTWTQQYTITVRRNATFEAKNEEEACDMASDYAEGADDCEMQDAIRYGNYSYDTDNGDYEAEEA